MLTEFRLTNFKAFAGPETFPIRPLTLIFGPNSSGKSSIFQCLLMLKQTIESADAKTNLLIKGDLVDLGSYREFIHRHEMERSFSFKAMMPSHMPMFLYNKLMETECEPLSGLIEDPSDLQKFFNDMFECIDQYEKIGLYIRFSCDKSNKIVIISRIELFAGDGSGYLFRYEKGLDEDLCFTMTSINRYHPKNPPTPWINFKVNDGPPGTIELDHFLPKYLDGADFTWFPQANYKDKREVLTPCAAINLEEALKSILYIGPMREYPERYFSFSGNLTDYVGKSGKFVPDILFSDNELKEKVNGWFERLGIPYQLKVPILSDPDSDIHDVLALRLLDKNGVHVGITDVGFGISQVIPLIIQSIISERKTILIEQPEYHLHPRLQAELGDMFIESALGRGHTSWGSPLGNTFLIETHSEHLILRILRRIRETAEGTLAEGLTPIKPDDVAVIYVQPGETGSRIIHIPVNEEGYFNRPWPDGFFAERARELL